MKKYPIEKTVGIFVIIGLLCIGYITLGLGDIRIFGESYSSYFARFRSVSGLRVRSPVQMFGIEVGRVEKLTMDQDKQMAVVELKLRKGIKIYRDAIASIKTAGLIGDKYVQIDPGGAENLLKPGDTILDTTSPVDIEELIGKYAFGGVKKDEGKE